MKQAFIILAAALFIIGTAQADTYYPKKPYAGTAKNQMKSGSSYPKKGAESSSRSAKQQSSKSSKEMSKVPAGKSGTRQKKY